MHIIKYRRYPNNEIRATHYYRALSQKEPASHSAVEQTCSDAVTSVSSEEEASSDAPSYLTLGAISDSRLAPLPFKKTKFGLNAKNTLLRIGGAYDYLSTSPSDFVFLTGTLPGNTPAAFRAIAEYSAYIAESIAHWIKRTVKSDYYFYVWELQKRGALHFHYCIYTPSRTPREKVILEFKQKWTDLLDDISTRSGICMWEGDSKACWCDRYGTLQAYAQEVHTSVAAYLSGYFGGAKDKHAQDESSPYYPRRWWGASRASTSLLEGLTEEVVVEHNNWRGANLEMQLFYEAVSHSTPHSHHYPHKVGVGSTVISYHPEDKGQKIWQGLQPMLYQPTTHPNTCSLIVRTRTALSHLLSFLEGCRKLGSPCLKQLSTTLKELCYPVAKYGYSISRRDIAIILQTSLDLNSPLYTHRIPERLRRELLLLQMNWSANLPKIRSDRHGYLCQLCDLEITVDNSYWIGYVSTTESEEDTEVTAQATSNVTSSLPCPTQLELF